MYSFLAPFSCGNLQDLWWAGQQDLIPPCSPGVSDNMMTLIKAGATFGVIKNNRSVRGRKSQAGLLGGKQTNFRLRSRRVAPCRQDPALRFGCSSLLCPADQRRSRHRFVRAGEHEKQPVSHFLFDFFFCRKVLPLSERGGRASERERERAQQWKRRQKSSNTIAGTAETPRERKNGGVRGHRRTHMHMPTAPCVTGRNVPAHVSHMYCARGAATGSHTTSMVTAVSPACVCVQCRAVQCSAVHCSAAHS